MAKKLTWKKDDLGAYYTELGSETLVITRVTDETDRLMGRKWELTALSPFAYLGAARTLAEAKALVEQML